MHQEDADLGRGIYNQREREKRKIGEDERLDSLAVYLLLIVKCRPGQGETRDTKLVITHQKASTYRELIASSPKP